jgi:predicted membrane protein
MMVADFINLILLVVYILGIIRKKLTPVRMVFRVYLVFFVIVVVGLFIGIVIAMVSTGRWTGLSILFDLAIMIFAILFCAIPIIIMRMGLRGLERVIESESRSNEEITSTTEKAGEK